MLLLSFLHHLFFLKPLCFIKAEWKSFSLEYAFSQGKNSTGLDANPYKLGSVLHNQWVAGKISTVNKKFK